MKQTSVHRTKHILGVALLMALASMSAHAQTQPAQNQAVQNQVAQPQTPPYATPLAPPAVAPGAPSAVTALQNNIGAQQRPLAANPVAVQQPIAAPTPVTVGQVAGGYPSVPPSSMDESTLLSEVGKSQAQMALQNIRAKMEQANMALQRDRLKFQQEQQEAVTKSAELVASQNQARGLTADGKAQVKSEDQEPEVKPSVRSIYSFDGKWFAEIVVGTNKVLASPGTVLVGGSKVVSISSSNVVVLNKGKRSVLPLDGSASVSAQAIAPSITPLPPLPASASAAPMPPSSPSRK